MQTGSSLSGAKVGEQPGDRAHVGSIADEHIAQGRDDAHHCILTMSAGCTNEESGDAAACPVLALDQADTPTLPCTHLSTLSAQRGKLLMFQGCSAYRRSSSGGWHDR